MMVVCYMYSKWECYSVDECVQGLVRARPLRGFGLLDHEFLQRVICLMAPFFETFAFLADFLLQRAHLVCVVLVERKGAAPEAAVDVGRFIAVDDLRLAGQVDGWDSSFFFSSSCTDLGNLTLSWHVVEQLGVECPAAEAWARVLVS